MALPPLRPTASLPCIPLNGESFRLSERNVRCAPPPAFRRSRSSVPIDPYIAGMLSQLPDAPVGEIMRDPALLAQVMEIFRDDRPYAPPVVQVDDESVPG